MTELNREQNFDSMTTLLRNVLESWLKAYLNTMRPGIIDSYDVERRRARVRPALRLVMSGDIPGTDGEALERALAVNVPVAWPAGGGMMSFFPLTRGDRGVLVFSERGMTEFKRTGELANPDRARFFDESDGVFIPCDFGHPLPDEVTLADPEAMTLQTYDGNTAFALKDGRVEIRVGPVRIIATESDVTITTPGDTLRVR